MISKLFGKIRALFSKDVLSLKDNWLDAQSSQQHNKKLHQQNSYLEEFNISYSEELSITSLGKEANRIFLDVTLQIDEATRTIGLFDIEDERIASMDSYPDAVPDLQDFVEALSNDLPPVERAEFRLRVNPFGQWGMWIDAANLDIRTLLNEQRWLTRWMEQAHIEIGPHRKYLRRINNRLSLEPPFPRQWFKTFLPTTNQDFMLWSLVGVDSQHSDNGVKHLVHSITKLLSHCEDATHWVEFDAGCGTFTLPLSQVVHHLTAVESSTISKQNLQRALKHHSIDNVTVSSLNVQRHTEQTDKLLERTDGVFVNPPRSGLGPIIQTLEKLEHPPLYIVYVSCNGRTLSMDGQTLVSIGYTLEYIEGVEQLPHTSHCEWISLWKRTT